MEAPAILAIEDVVSQVWCATLGLEQLPPRANVFNLGADSLTAVSVAVQLTARLGVELTLADVLATPVLDEFVAWLAEMVEDEDE